MLLLHKNKRPVRYKLYLGQRELRDESGHRTGTHEAIYSEPVEIKAYVSLNDGAASTEFFGVHTPYSRVLFVEGTDCPITETSIVETDGVSYIVKSHRNAMDHIEYALLEAPR